MREIEVTPTKSYTGAVTPNDPVRVYDCSGPWGDPAFTGTSEQGLPALRRDWILKRGDVEEIDGREVKPQDDGYLSGKHAEYASKAEKNRLVEFPGLTAAPPPAPREGRQSRHATRLRPRRHHHAGDGIHRHPREHGPREDRRDVEGHRSQRPQQTARRFIAARQEPLHAQHFQLVSPSASPRRSRPSSSAPKSPPAAPSSRTTSITPSPSR
jgi:hypothetical protein